MLNRLAITVLVAASQAAGCTFDGPDANDVTDAGSSTPDATGGADAILRACTTGSEYSMVGDGLYRFLEAGNYTTAQSACSADDARLVTIRSQSHLAEIMEELIRLNVFSNDCLLNGPATPCALVGARQRDDSEESDEGWQWSSNTSLASDDPLWRGGQPDDNGGGENDAENCAVATSQLPVGLDDRPCSDFTYPAVCECLL